MKRYRNTTLAALFLTVLVLMLSPVAQARESEPSGRVKHIKMNIKGFSQKNVSVTRHTIKIGDQIIPFTARAGYMPIKDEKGKLKAKIFFISYTRDQVKNAANRPITFAFNGGPGSSSMWLHFGALGPKRVKLTDKGTLPPPPYEYVENQYTWLAFTDLVFIDPVDTGFSRAADKKYYKEFFGVQEDIQSVGEFIRLYVTIFRRWPSPKFIAGESYGATRAAGLAKYLQERVGMHLNGIVLVSQALNYKVFESRGNSFLPHILYLPSFTATAFYHKRLSPRLQRDLKATLHEVEQWSSNEYYKALFAGSSLPTEEKKKVADKLEEYTGIPAQYYLNSNLRISSDQFRRQLLKDEHLSVGYYDGRLTGISPSPESKLWPWNDPTFFLSGPFVASVQDYVRNSLKYVNDLPYNASSWLANRKWNWLSAVYPNDGYVDMSGDLSSAMNRNKYLKLFVACGYHDLCTPYYGTIYVVNQLNLSPETRKNIRFGFYIGGHMMYTSKKGIKLFSRDIARFYRWCSNKKPKN